MTTLKRQYPEKVSQIINIIKMKIGCTVKVYPCGGGGHELISWEDESNGIKYFSIFVTDTIKVTSGFSNVIDQINKALEKQAH